MLKQRIECKFDAAHFLPEYEGACANMHGHTWKVAVEFYGAIKDGMGLDFKEAKRILNSILPDHCLLNDIPELPNPTAENIAIWLSNKLPDILPAIVTRIEIWESESACAIVEN